VDDVDPESESNRDDLETQATHATIKSAKYGRWGVAIALFGLVYVLATDFGILSVRTEQGGETIVVFNSKPISAIGDLAVDQWDGVTNWLDERERKKEAEERREEQEKQEARQERIERYGEFRAGRGFWSLAGFFLLAVVMAFGTGGFVASKWKMLTLSIGCFLLIGLGYIVLFWPSLGPGTAVAVALWVGFSVAAVSVFNEELAEKRADP
jgi:hypothetical protein